MNKLIVILGPTSSGKSTLGIKLARKFKGEIISADSRQVYKGMDIGTGKVPISQDLRSKTPAKSSIPAKAGIYSGGIRHYLIDVASPKKQFTVADFKSYAKRAIAQITKGSKIPFIVGGTPFYIYSLIDDWNIPEVAPNPKLRSLLRSKSTTQLFKMLQKLDPRRAGNIDPHNPARLIRAIEIVKATGSPIPYVNLNTAIQESNAVLILGIKKDQNQLYKLIDERLEQRLKAGMVAEIKKLHKSGVSWKRLESFGLEYRFGALYLQGHLKYDEMVTQLKNAIHKFSKRQMTWFKRDNRINWIKSQFEAERLIKKYLKH